MERVPHNLGRPSLAHPAMPPAARWELCQQLREQIARWEAHRPRAGSLISTGWPALDHALPDGGLHRGTLVEWLSPGEGSGVETLALGTAREACREGAVLVVLDGVGDFYPPAASRLGIDLQRLIVVRPATQADHLWALDQALRAPGVGAVFTRLERLDGRTFRRLQLAAEQAGTLGLLVRPAPARQEPSWAEVRFWVEPLAPSHAQLADGADGWRRLRVAIVRCRGVLPGRTEELSIADETHPVFVDSPPNGTGRLGRAAGF